MKKKQLATIVLASAMMVSSLAACGNSSDGTTTSSGGEATTAAPAATTEANTAEPDTTAPEPEKEAAPSVDFEDGKSAFAVVATNIGGADPSVMSVVDANGSKALKLENAEGGKMFVAINVSALLGDKLGDLKEIRMNLGTENADGFAASSGTLYCYTGEDNHEFKAGNWSVYIDSANPKTAKFDVSGAGFVAGKDNYIILSKETDNSKTKPSNLLIDNIAFLNAAGETLAADTSVEFGNPAGFSSASDSANLFGLVKPVNWEGFAVKGDGWAQNGVAMTEEIKAALVPGSVIEIKFKSETGHMWVVMNEAEVGWSRVGVGDWDGSGQQYAYINNAGDTCQVTYEQIAAVCGDDIAKWGSMIQCESDGAWEVSSVRVGTAAPMPALTHAVNWEGFAVKGDGWAQNGVAMTDEIKAALVPGSMIEVSYKSESGNMWLVMNEAEVGWTRVGVGDADGSGQGYIVQTGSKAYIPYEMIAQYCGDDIAKWGSMIQCESDTAWEVYGVRVGTAAEFKATNAHIELGTGKKGDGWAQDGFDLTEDMIAALVPGSVIDISYKSETGEIWVVMPDAAAGWKRVGVGDYDGSGQGYALFDGSHCQISYEMIAEQCGEDKSTWGARIQFEASSAWEVNGAWISNAKVPGDN
ncbi:MAG: hypothetical protein IJM25_05315 [Eubacterium sp.]|nr:hypothetical protein [Eubacterium sp.]